jgi:hypothetical protein
VVGSDYFTRYESMFCLGRCYLLLVPHRIVPISARGKHIFHLYKLCAFRTRNTIQNIIKSYSQTDKYEKMGMCQIKCIDCQLKCVGQTGRTFHTRYKEHIQANRSYNDNSGYSHNILNTGHTYGTLTVTINLTITEKKAKYLNTERI